MTTSLTFSNPSQNQRLLPGDPDDYGTTAPSSPEQTPQLTLSTNEYYQTVIKRLAYNCSTLKLFCCCLPLTSSLAFAGAYFFTPYFLSQSNQNSQATEAAIIAAFAVAGILFAPIGCAVILPLLCQRCCGIFVTAQPSNQPDDIIIDFAQSPFGSPMTSPDHTSPLSTV